MPRPVLVAVETWRSTSLQTPVQTFPQFFREQTVNKKVGTNVLLFSINSPPSLSIGHWEKKKTQAHVPNSGAKVRQWSRQIAPIHRSHSMSYSSAEFCNILRILWYSVRKGRKRRCRPNIYLSPSVCEQRQCVIGVVVPCNEWKLSILQSGLQHFLIIDSPRHLRQRPDANCNIIYICQNNIQEKLKVTLCF